jgi:cellulose synthase operon protein YhjQ
MPLVCIASPKGGVGRTTLTATLAVALRRLGRQVVAIDLDRQNALRLNFELPEDLRGIAHELDTARAWRDLATETPAGIFVVPFGAVPVRDGADFHSYVAQHPGLVHDRLAALLAQPDLLVVADLPAGPTAVDWEIHELADLYLIALLPDAMSLALLPRLQHGEYLSGTGGRRPPVGYVLNQIDPRRQLCRDVLALSRDVLGDAVYGIVHQDEGVAEAAACQLTVLDYAPDSVASQDLMALARRIHGSLAPH